MGRRLGVESTVLSSAHLESVKFRFFKNSNFYLNVDFPLCCLSLCVDGEYMLSVYILRKSGSGSLNDDDDYVFE